MGAEVFIFFYFFSKVTFPLGRMDLENVQESNKKRGPLGGTHGESQDLEPRPENTITKSQ